MFKIKRLVSAAVAAATAVSCLTVSPAVFAADDEDKWTFDGLYMMNQTVSGLYLDTENDFDAQEELEEAIEKATGVRDYEDITYEDLAKVRTLNLSGMELTDVPACINYMVNITRLDLSNNLLQSDALKKLSLVGCTKLSSVNLSRNYLTTMPSWFLADRVTTGNITYNFVDSTNPRYIEPLITTYYLMDGEELDEGALQNQILKSIRLNDGNLLPEMFFDYNDPSDLYNELRIVGWESFTEDGKVLASQDRTIEVTVQLFNDGENANTNTTVTIYLLSGKNLNSLKNRLESLVEECGALPEDEYTASSWNNLVLAADTAEAILQYTQANVQMLTNAFDALIDARDGLRYGTKALQDTLKGLITVGKTYKQEDYTPSSWTTFSNALARLESVSADDNATLETAQSAVLQFQRAQSSLSSAELVLPDTILKSEFEAIYGENRTITASGTTRAGTSYKWFFYGKDLVEAADFNPEVLDSDSNESAILLEAGSNSGYRMFVTSDTKPLPGKATLELNVSDKFTSGSFYLYRWDSSAKRSLMAGTAEVVGGVATIPLTEGGVYYLCRNVQNFNLESESYEIDHEKKTVTIPPTLGVSVSEFKNNFSFGAYTSVLDENGNAVSSTSRVKPNMTINAPHMDLYSIELTGDIDGSGGVDINDLVVVVDALFKQYESSGSIGEDGADGSVGGALSAEELAVCDLDGDGVVSAIDVAMVADYYFMALS